MKYKNKLTYIIDKDEPVFRSCWECNSGHEHLKDAEFLHLCFACGKYWIHGKYLSDFKTEDEMDKFLKENLEKEQK